MEFKKLVVSFDKAYKPDDFFIGHHPTHQRAQICFSNADKIIDYLKFKNQLKVMRGFVLLLKILADAGRV